MATHEVSEQTQATAVRAVPVHAVPVHAVPVHAVPVQAVPVRAHGRVLKRLGHWTGGRRLDVRASRASVVLDLRSPRIDTGDIEVRLDLDRATVKLLVPDGAVVEDSELRRIGRGKVTDWTGLPSAGGRRIVLHGELRSAEVRVHRGGIAVLSAMCSRQYLTDARLARREGRLPVIDDPGREA